MNRTVYHSQIKKTIQHPFRYVNIVLGLTLLSIALQACSPQPAEADVSGSEVSKAQVVVDAQATHFPDVSPTPTFTPVPIVNVQPTATPTTEPFWSTEVITTQNVTELKPIRSVGRGAIEEVKVIQKGKIILAKTANAIYVYTAEDFVDILTATDTYAYAVSPDETHLLTSHPNGLVKYWDISTGALVDEYLRVPEMYRFREPMEDPSQAYIKHWAPQGGAVAFFPDGSGFAAGAHDGGITVWRFGEKEPESVFIDDILNSIAIELAISPNGETIAVLTGSKYFLPERQPGYFYYDSRLIFISTKDNKIVSYQRDPGGIMSPAFSPDGKYMLTSIKQNLYLWDAVTGASSGHFGVNLDQPYFAEFNPSWDEISLTGTVEGKLTKLTQKFPQGNLISKTDLEAAGDNTPYSESNLINAGHYANPLGIHALQNGSVSLWNANYWFDLETGTVSEIEQKEITQKTYAPEIHGQAYCTNGSFHFSSDNKKMEIPIPSISECRFAYAFPEHNIAALLTPYRFALLNLEDHTTQEITGFQKPIEWVTLSSDGTTMATGSFVPNHDNAQLIFWSLSPLKRLIETDLLDSKPFKYMEFSEDNNFLYAMGSRARKWRVTDGENIIIYPIENPSAMALSPKEDLVAVSEYSGLIHLYESNSTKELYTIKGTTDPVLITFNHDQTALIVVDGNGITQIYGIN